MATLALTGPMLESVVQSITVGLLVSESGTRSAVMLYPYPTELAFIGRWEVMPSAAADALPCAVLRIRPQGGVVSTLGALPRPLPEELFLRFMPELPETAYSAPGTRGFACGRPLVIRLHRDGEKDQDDRRVVVYTRADGEAVRVLDERPDAPASTPPSP